MGVDYRNVLGFIGLILLFIYGPTILEHARGYSPFRGTLGLGASPEQSALILLGAIIVAALLLVKRSR